MNLDFKTVLVLLLIVLGIVVFVLIKKHTKSLKLPNVFLITGAVKVGKTAISVQQARKIYRRNLMQWYLRYPLLKLFKKEIPLKPMFYTNIPVTFKHNRLTKDIILRNVRIPNKSVVLIDEASLLADSMLWQNDSVNRDLLLFVKLFGHYSHNGTLIFNSHTCSDLHHAIKRSVGRYLYVYSTTRFPLISVSCVREMVYSDDSNVVNDVSQDTELSMRKIWFFNRVFKTYDPCCYSILTDYLKYQVDYDVTYDRKRDLKCSTIVSFNKYFENLSIKRPRSESSNQVDDTLGGQA